jgi:hypothetical protein
MKFDITVNAILINIFNGLCAALDVALRGTVRLGVTGQTESFKTKFSTFSACCMPQV